MAQTQTETKTGAGFWHQYSAQFQPVRTRPIWVRYLAALLCVGAGWGLRVGLTPFIGPTNSPFMAFLLSVVLTASIGGFGPALVALLLSSVIVNWFFLEPIGQFVVSRATLATLATFLFLGFFAALMVERLHRKRELLATTLASIGDAVIVTDAASRIVFLNGEAEHLTGWKVEAAIRKPSYEVFHIVDERTRERVECPTIRAIKTGQRVTLSKHVALVSQTGNEWLIDDTAAPIHDVSGALVGAVLVFRDVTQQRRSERAAIRLASIVENSNDAILAKDLNGIVTHWNAAAERMFGYSAAEMIGRSVRELVPRERQGEEDHVLATVARGEPVQLTDTQRMTKDGRLIPVSLSVSPLRQNNGSREVVGCSTIVHDLTARKQMEQQLRRAHEDLEDYAKNLEELVHERTRNLESTIAELEGVSYSLSHDMRAPLRAIQGFSQFVLKEADGRLTAQEKELLQKCVRAAARLDRLIRDVLSYSRVAREHIHLRTIDTEHLVRQIIDERPDFQPPKVQIEIRSPLLPVRGHEAYLSQCITNLLDNGIKFVRPEQAPHIQIWSEDGNERVRLFFEDNGIGIPKEAKERIFGLFQRLHADHEYAGTGVGLTIVRKAVERMGGTTGVESEPGKFSRFWIDLPKGT